MPACSDFTCPWWSAPQMSMRWFEPRRDLVAVVREVVAEIRRGAVGPHEHAVARVAEVGRAQPARAVLLVTRRRVLVEHAQHVGDLVALVQRALGEPGVEVHADAAEVVADAVDDAPHAPLARVVGRHVVAELGAQVARPGRRGTRPGTRPRAAARPGSARTASRGTSRAGCRCRSGSTRGARRAPCAASRFAIASPTATQRPPPACSGPVGLAETNSRLIRCAGERVGRPKRVAGGHDRRAARRAARWARGRG